MENWLTKKNILLCSSLYVLALIALYASHFDCYQATWCNGSLGDFMGGTILSLSPLAVIFLFSLLTYRMRDDIFAYWVTFTKWYFPVWIFCSFFFFTTHGHGGGFGGLIDKWLEAIFAWGLFSLYPLVSIILITRKWFALREKDLKKLHKHEAKHHHT